MGYRKELTSSFSISLDSIGVIEMVDNLDKLTAVQSLL